MTAKEFMEKVRQAESELRLINKKRLHYQELATSIGVKLTGMPGGQKGGSMVETGAVAIVDLMAELDAKEKEYTAVVKKAEGLISKIRQEKFRKILTLRYITGCSWKIIRDEMEYKDEKSVYRCHGYALRELQKVM